MKWFVRAGATLVAVFVLASFGFVRGLAGPLPLAAAPRGGVFEDVVLIEPGLGRSPHLRLRVEGSRIESIEPIEGAALDVGSATYSGAYVLPGLVDAHAHFPPSYLPGQVELYAYLFLRHGVTGVRSPSDVFPGTSKSAKSSIEAGDFAGPRVTTCGRFVDGPNPVFGSALVVETADEARAAVEQLAAEGYPCVKAYNELDNTTLGALREAAHARGMSVIGHVPWRLSFEEARLDDVQHLLGFHPLKGPPGFKSSGGWVDVTDEKVESVIAAALRADIAMTPTVVAGHRIGSAREIARDPSDPMRRWLPPWYAEALWHETDGIGPASRMSPSDFDRVQRANLRQRQVVAQLYRAGVDLRAGTDTFAPLIVPGASLQEELELYVDGGLTPEEALAIGTRGSARALDVAGLGRLQAGAPADFALYRDDPTQGLAALATLLAVVQDGRVYTREMLDRQDERYRADFAGFFQQRIATPVLRAGLDLLLAQSLASGSDEVD